MRLPIYDVSMEVGQRVRLIAVPDGITDDGEFQTLTLLKACVGGVFTISDMRHGLLALDVGDAAGKAAFMESVKVEPACVEPIG